MSRGPSALLVSAIMAFSVRTVSGKECHSVTFPERTQVQATP
jgi:hypothetical protein